MDDHGMTEGAAFSFIQKTAMKERRTMRQVADEILAGALVPPT
jgi:AmiR/NasT family two-component response regulator